MRSARQRCQIPAAVNCEASRYATSFPRSCMSGNPAHHSQETTRTLAFCLQQPDFLSDRSRPSESGQTACIWRSTRVHSAVLFGNIRSLSSVRFPPASASQSLPAEQAIFLILFASFVYTASHSSKLSSYQVSGRRSLPSITHSERCSIFGPFTASLANAKISPSLPFARGCLPRTTA